jgi:ATP-dependent DNA helicase RecG
MKFGDFLKELDMTEGRGTGIPIIRKEMAKNGSPEPRFETDENYSYFITTLPIHLAFLSDDGINNGVSDGINIIENQKNKIVNLIRDGVSDGISDGINEIVNILLNVSGLSAIEIASRIDKSIPTVERYIRILRRRDIIEYRGSKKTGGYYLTDKAKDKLK